MKEPQNIDGLVRIDADVLRVELEYDEGPARRHHGLAALQYPQLGAFRVDLHRMNAGLPGPVPPMIEGGHGDFGGLGVSRAAGVEEAVSRSVPAAVHGKLSRSHL